MKLSVSFVVVAVSTFMVSGPAGADPVRLVQNARLLPAYEIRTILRSTGLDPIGPARRRGQTYVMRALDDDDREVRVVVDARYGEVISVAPILAPPVRPGRRIATVPPDDDGPRVIYDAPDIDDEEPLANRPRIVMRLPSSARVMPSRRPPPLPRPRPAEASLASTNGAALAAEPASAAREAPATEPKKQEVEVPPVAPLDPDNRAPIAN